MTEQRLPAPLSDTDQDEWEQFIELVRTSVRAHAGYFSWLSDRTIEEAGVVDMLHKSLDAKGMAFFHSCRSRGAGNDPPDCEALTDSGARIAFEVTELVDGASIAAAKRNEPVPWQPWTYDEIRALIEERIRRKDAVEALKGGPYTDYIVVIYTDEPRILDFSLIESVAASTFGPVRQLTRAFLLMSYSPWEQCCPFVELRIK